MSSNLQCWEWSERLYAQRCGDGSIVLVENHGSEEVTLSADMAQAFARWVLGSSVETTTEPRNWAMWRCYRHGRLFAAHAGCSMCINDPDPSSSNAQKTNGDVS